MQLGIASATSAFSTTTFGPSPQLTPTGLDDPPAHKKHFTCAQHGEVFFASASIRSAPYPFTAVPDSPWIMNRCPARNTSSIGRIPAEAAAIMPL
jgi:hypothetical protein